MPVRIEANAEPIPGYRLIERLGGGGFGEVWKAEAPGGLLKAIKFVFGDLEAADDADGARATQELKALSRVKTVHHPYILSLERYDIIDGQLIIVMELADRTLWDRFRECRTQGLPGIPRAELLPYMRETAEALDLMNTQFQLQHLDIKPQNLFLVFNHIKVADFGLVKDLGNMAAATVTGGVTPVYAAPETFDGWLSRFSDQYSLAIVFQELLTGQRPFAGSTMRQLVLQHLQGEPDVSSLPARDRPIIQHALAKNPDKRFPSCLEFVQALEVAGVARPSSPAAAETARADLPPLPPLADTQHSAALAADAEQADMTCNARGRSPRAEPAPDDQSADHDRPNVLPPRPTGPRPEAPPPSEPRSVTTTRSQRPKNMPASATDSDYRGIVQPSLIVGLGKLGLQTLLALRRTLSEAFGHPDALPHIRLVGIDTDADMIREAGQGGSHAILRPHELVLARLHRPSHYLQQRTRDGDLPTDSWLNSKLIYRLPKQKKTAGLRALGRLAFVDNYRHIAKRLESELQCCAAQDTLHELVRQTDLGIRSPIPRVYVVAGLGGNTGSGMFLDTAYTLRHLLRKHGFSRADVVGVFFLPALAHEGIRSEALAHGFAALTELHHYASGQSVFSATYPEANPASPVQPISEAGPPFERCFLMTLPPCASATVPDAVPETAVLAGQFLYRDVATSLGKTVDAVRQQWRLSAPASAANTPTYQTLGLYRIVRPRRRVLEQSARRLCRRLVAHWMTKDATPLVETLSHWAQEQWDDAGLRPEALISRHQELCEQRLQQTPERLLQGVLNPLVPVLTPPDAGKPDAAPINAAPVVAAMAGLEKLLGIPEDCRTGNPTQYPPGVIEEALHLVAASLADTLDHQLTTLIVRLLEEPAYRLAGAEQGLRQFCQSAEHALQAQETLTKELHERATTMYQRIQTLLETPQPAQVTPTTTSWKFSFAKKSAGVSNFGADLLELLRVYAKTRYQSLILRHINRLYVGLRGHLSDQIREVSFCRQRLGELAGLLEHKSAAAPWPTASFEKLLLPAECSSIADVVDRLDARLVHDDLIAFDQVMQPVICQQYRALLHVCMGPSNLVRTLAPVMIQEAETFLAEQLRAEARADCAMNDPDNTAGADELSSAFDEAAPECGKLSAQKEIAVAAFPTTPHGRHLKDLAQQALPGVQLIDADDGDEITFYRELQQVTLQDLEQYGSLAQEAYRQCSANDPTSLHSRIDVPCWQPAAS